MSCYPSFATYMVCAGNLAVLPLEGDLALAAPSDGGIATGRRTASDNPITATANW